MRFHARVVPRTRSAAGERCAQALEAACLALCAYRRVEHARWVRGTAGLVGGLSGAEAGALANTWAGRGDPSSMEAYGRFGDRVHRDDEMNENQGMCMCTTTSTLPEHQL